LFQNKNDKYIKDKKYMK
jgi:hypothetical protein